jgi:hypothetical protein
MGRQVESAIVSVWLRWGLRVRTLGRRVSSGRGESGHLMVEPPIMPGHLFVTGQVFLPAAGIIGSPVAGSRTPGGAAARRACPVLAPDPELSASKERPNGV